MYIIICLTDILNHNFLTCAKAEIWALTVCIVVNGEKFHAVTLALIGQCPMSSYFRILQYVKVSSQLNHYVLSYRVHRHTHRQTDRQTHTHTHTDGHEYSLVADDKPQL